MLCKRQFLVSGLALASVAPFARLGGAAQGEGSELLPTQVLAQIEQETGGRLGVAAIDTGTGHRSLWRAEERFAMCSSFKFLLAAVVLMRVDAGQEQLSRRVPVTQADILTWSPVLESQVGTQQTVDALCAAIMSYSDNAAANLLLKSVGGPQGLTQMLRQAGDPITRLDRYELELNEALPGDPRDTSTPLAMADNLERFVLGDVLSARSRDQLAAWLRGNKTGDKRIRAGVPSDWTVGDRTGTCSSGVVNDVAILYPPNRAPLLLAIMLAEAPLTFDQASAVHAEIARSVVAHSGS